MADRDVIHKLLYRLDPDQLDQEFTVPRVAQLVAVGPDSREPDAIALWYVEGVPHPQYTGMIYTGTWRITVRGTGDPFPSGLRHIGTVMIGSNVWHLLDLEPNRSGSVSSRMVHR